MKSPSCAATLLALACALVSPKLAEAADPIRFGLVVPLSGPVAVFGVPEKQAVDLMTEEVNGKGGILGRKLRSSLTTTRRNRKRLQTSPPG